MIILRGGLNLQTLDGSEEDEHSAILIFGEMIRSVQQFLIQQWHTRLKTMAVFNQNMMKQEETNAQW